MDLNVQADQITWSQGEATADGQVVVIFGDQRLEGSHAVWSPGRVVVEHGTYIRPDGIFAFDRAEVDLAADTAVILQARVDTEGVALQVGKATLQSGHWEGETVGLEPCACEDGQPGALSFSAKRVVVVPERVVILYGGLMRVFTVPVLPVPYLRFPLNPDHFRLLIPELSYGSNGWAAGWQAQGGVAGWTLKGGPAWRQDRGFRGELSVEGPGNYPGGGGVATAPTVFAEGGWDSEMAQFRGAYATRGGYAAWKALPGLSPFRVAWDGALLSDPGYAEDYGVDWITRGVAWRDQRLTATWGPERLQLWLPDDQSYGPVAGLTQQIRIGKALSFSPSFAVQAWSTGATVLPREFLDLQLRGAGIRGPVEASFAVDAWGSAFGFDNRQAGGTAKAEADLVFWGEARDWRAIWRPGVRAEGEAIKYWDLLTYLAPLPTGRVGPGLGLSLLHGGGMLELDASALYGATGWKPRVRLDWGLGDFTGYTDLQTLVQSGKLRWDAEVFGVGIGSTHAESFWIASADAMLHWRRLRSGGGLAWDLFQQKWAGAGVQVGYDDGCSSAMLTTRFSPDRLLPDFGLQVAVRK